MEKNNESLTVNKVIAKTALKTLLILLIVFIFGFSTFILAAPYDAGRYLYKIGLKKLGTTIYYDKADRDKDFDGYFNSLTLGVGCNYFDVARGATDAMLSNTDFETKIKAYNLKIPATSYDFSAKDYVRYYSIYSGVMLSKDKGQLSSVYSTAMLYSTISNYPTGWHYYNKSSAIRGYFVGLIDKGNMSDELFDDCIAKMVRIYTNTDMVDDVSINWSFNNTGDDKYIIADAIEMYMSRGLTNEQAKAEFDKVFIK